MLTELARNWWVVLFRGIAAVVFGVLMIVLPTDIVIGTLMIILAAYLLVDGALSVGGALSHRKRDTRWSFALIEGLIGIGAAAVAFIYPDLTALVLLYIIAFWAIFTGIVEIMLSYEIRKQIANEWMLALSGVLSLVFGTLLVLFPGSGITAVLWLVGLYAILFGTLLIILSLRLRALNEDLREMHGESWSASSG